ncbi:DUF3786 domain-containing protein [Thermodesulfobacteriota bacterium]
MARIDDFKQAKALAKQELLKIDPDFIAGKSGTSVKKEKDEIKALSLVFLNRTINITWPELEFSYDGSDGEIHIQQQGLILHYLNGICSMAKPGITGEWISFQDIPDGRFYMDPFIKRAKIPLVQTFGNNPAKMKEIAKKAYNAEDIDFGDYSVLIKALPFIPVVLVIWEGDDEFPPEGNLLFDMSISDIFSAEDIATLAGMVVYPMIGMAYK